MLREGLKFGGHKQVEHAMCRVSFLCESLDRGDFALPAIVPAAQSFRSLGKMSKDKQTLFEHI